MVVLASACTHFHREKTKSEVNPAKPKETNKMLVECGKTEPGALCHQCRRPLAVASQVRWLGGLTLDKQHMFPPHDGQSGLSFYQGDFTTYSNIIELLNCTTYRRP